MIDKDRIFLYFTVFITGGAVLALEVLGARIISPFYGTTVFVWTSLIIITLGALALGYFVGGFLVDKYKSENLLFSIIFTSGIFFLIPMKIDQLILPFTDKFGLQYGPLISAIFLFFIPLFLLGTVSPFIIRLTASNLENAGKNAGIVFALGTLGSIIGGFLAGFYLLDKLSITESLNYTALLLIIISVIGILKNKNKLSFLSGIALLFLFLNIWNIPKHEHKDNYTLQIIHQEQSLYADLKVIEIAGMRCLVMDGATQSCTNLKKDKTVFGSVIEMGEIISIEASKKDRLEVLLLGLGGNDLSKLLPNNVTLDTIEIDQRVAELSKEYTTRNENIEENIYIDDARHFLETKNKKYDVIVSDLSLGNTVPPHLFSKEAINSFENNLKDDGLVIVHFSGKSNSDDETLSSIYSTSGSVFNKVIATKVKTNEDYHGIQNIILHLSKNNSYEYPERNQSLYTAFNVLPKEVIIISDSKNPLHKYPLEYTKDFRDSMINFGGYRMLFSI